MAQPRGKSEKTQFSVSVSMKTNEGKYCTDQLLCISAHVYRFKFQNLKINHVSIKIDVNRIACYIYEDTIGHTTSFLLSALLLDL